MLVLIEVKSDRHSLQPRVVENSTHLAHSLVRYLGLSSPGELSAFGISSSGDLTDLISRVSTVDISAIMIYTF
jgi:SET and MYND domain-containing protein